MSKTIFKRYGLGLQIQRVHYRDEKLNSGFKSAYAPLTIGYRQGKFTFKVRRPKTVEA